MFPEDDDTTQPGVSADDTSSAETPEVSQDEEVKDEAPSEEPERPRSAREDIFARHREQRREELKITDEEPAEPKGEEAKPEDEPKAEPERETKDDGQQRDDKGRSAAKTEEPKPEEKAEPEKAPEKPETKPQERMVKVKVDGKEQEIPESELVRGYQTAASANARMREANRLKKEAEALSKSAKEQQPTPQAAPPQPKPEVDGDKAMAQAEAAGATDKELHDLAEKIAYGETEDIAAALKSIVERQKGDVDPEAIVQRVMSQAVPVVERQLQYKSDLDYFAKTFPEIVEDQELSYLAAGRINKMRLDSLAEIIDIDPDFNLSDRRHLNWLVRTYAEQVESGTVPPLRDLFHRAGEEVREKYGTKPKSTPGDGADKATVRVERDVPKENLHQPPSGANQRGRIASEPKRPTGKGGTDTVNWLRKQRGQPPI